MAEVDYDLVSAIEALSEVINGFEDPKMLTYNNHYITDLGIDFEKECRKFYDILYSLCENIVKQGIVEDVKSELIDDNADTYYFNEIVEELDYFAKEKAHEEVMYDVEVGDKVRLKNGNIRYVHSMDGSSLEGTTLWVTPSRDTERGWSAQLSDVVEILEKNDEW